MSQPSIYTRLLFGLAGHSRNGLRLAEIASGIGESSPTTLRNLQRMEEDGLVEKVAHLKGHWRLTPRVVQMALAHQEEVATEDRITHEFKQRFSRLPT